MPVQMKNISENILHVKEEALLLSPQTMRNQGSSLNKNEAGKHVYSVVSFEILDLWSEGLMSEGLRSWICAL
jgi:hypothetical protein